MAEGIRDKIEEPEHQMDIDIILNRMREFINKIEELKINYNKLSKQVKSGEIDRKALIQLRDKLCLEIKTFPEQSLRSVKMLNHSKISVFCKTKSLLYSKNFSIKETKLRN